MKSELIREKFLSFFEKHEHQRVASSSLIPANDPTLLFANAGMNQFKDLFLGHEKRSYTRACSSQKCVRAGGKHNDLENVGYTARHHTFFEMLGNFSFGEYFKRDAIRFAWDFLTKELQIDEKRLYVTVFTDDDEAAELWQSEIGIEAERIFRFGEKDNFWAMGDTGPCGPCSEIFYDFGPQADGPEDPFEGIESGSDRYMEIWNLVFMQFDRKADGSMEPLPNPSIDTGMGLERVSSVVQGVFNNYDTDLFQDLIQPMAKALKVDVQDPSALTALRVIADHLRSISFLIADGVTPSNEGRGYVLRRIMRRAMRYAKQLGKDEPVLFQLTRFVVEKMGSVFGNLVDEADQIKTILEVEEKQFDTTLQKGFPILQKYLEKLQADGLKAVPGQVIFFMYGTHGFPVDLMADVARDYDLEMDMAGFEQLAEEEARNQQHESQFQTKEVHPELVKLAETQPSEHLCYGPLEIVAETIQLLKGDQPCAELHAGDEAVLILDKTSFYAESGGQIGDVGIIVSADGSFAVNHTTKVLDRLILHHGKVTKGTLKLGQAVDVKVDGTMRAATMKNHTATHLMHQALKDVLGRHVRQAGSLVDAEKTRFDFSHFQPLSVEQIAEIEDRVNAEVFKNTTLNVALMPIEEAKKEGAVALFGEKYGDQVRVITIGDYSKELCGGTHVGATGEIGLFKIISERALASGIRRIVAITGPEALIRFRESESLLAQAQDRFAMTRSDLLDQIQKLIQDRKQLEQQLEDLKLSFAKGGGSSEQVDEVGEIKVLSKKVSAISGGALRQLADELLNKVSGGVVLLASEANEKVQLLVKSGTAKVHAGEIVKVMAQAVGGSGGGRPDMAMAGGKDVSQMEAALKSGLDAIRSQTS